MPISSFSINPTEYRKHVAPDGMQEALADIEYALRKDILISRRFDGDLPYRVKGGVSDQCLQVFGTPDDIGMESTEIGLSGKLHSDSYGECPYANLEFVEVPQLWLNVARTNAAIPIQERSVDDVIAMRSPQMLRELAQASDKDADLILEKAIHSPIYSEYQKNIARFDFAYHLGIKVKESFHHFLHYAEQMCRKSGASYEGPYMAGALCNLTDKYADTHPEMIGEIFDWRQRTNDIPAEEIVQNTGLLFVPYDIVEKHPEIAADRVLELCEEGSAMDSYHVNRLYRILMNAQESLPMDVKERLIQDIQTRDPDFYGTVAYRLEEILHPSRDLLSDQTVDAAYPSL